MTAPGKKFIVLLVCLLNLFVLNGQTAEVDLLKTINRGSMPAWDSGMKGLSASTYPVAAISPFAIWTHGYLKKDKELMRSGCKSAIALCLAMGISTGLKYGIQRERPYARYPADITARDHSETYSFPSGHSTAAFATATALSFTYKKWYIAVPAYAYAGFVGYSRMRLGMHYPGDVLGSMAIGIGSGWLTWQLDKWMRRKRSS